MACLQLEMASGAATDRWARGFSAGQCRGGMGEQAGLVCCSMAVCCVHVDAGAHFLGSKGVTSGL